MLANPQSGGRVKAPDSNTGPLLTQPAAKTLPMVDWLEYTAQETIPQNAWPHEPRETWTQTSRGLLGYRERWITPSGVDVLAAGTSTMGTHVRVPGTACAYWRKTQGRGLYDILRAAMRIGATFTRLDVAIDCYTPQFVPQWLAVQILQGNAVGQMRGRPKHVGRPGENGTLYLGTRGGMYLLRCYDKAAEQATAASKRKEEYTGPACWTRLEYELRERAADDMVTAYLDGTDTAVAGLLNRAISIKIPSGTDSNRTRWDIHPTWSWLLGGSAVAGPPRTLPRPPSRIEEMEQWLLEVVAPTLATVYEVRGDPLITRLLATGRVRITPDKAQAISAHQLAYDGVDQPPD